MFLSGEFNSLKKVMHLVHTLLQARRLGFKLCVDPVKLTSFPSVRSPRRSGTCWKDSSGRQKAPKTVSSSSGTRGTRDDADGRALLLVFQG